LAEKIPLKRRPWLPRGGLFSLKHKWGIALILIVFALISALPVHGSAASDKKNIDKLINKTRDEIVRQKQKERSTLGNLLKQQQELERLERNYNQVKAKLEQTQEELYTTKEELQRLESSLRQLNIELKEQQNILDRRLVALYKYGPQSFLEILFHAEDFVDFVSRFGTVAYFVRRDLALISQFKSTSMEITLEQREIEAKKAQVEGKYREIRKLQQKAYAEQQKVESKVKSTQSELTKIQNDRVKLERALAEYEKTSREIEAQIRKSQAKTSKSLGTGQLIWPARGRISSPFGWRTHPVLKTKKYHSGIDIAVPTGTPVLAADDGVVLVSGWRGGYGYFVAIDHGKSISTCYGHNSQLLVKVGEKVTKGQRVALSGNTGLSTGPHLHFEVRVNGTPTNPLQYLN